MTVLAMHTVFASKPAGGITLTPATMTLTLQKGDTKQTATFDVINQYQTPISLHFTFDLPITETSGQSPATGLSISQPEVTLGPNETAHMVVTLQDSKTLPPGSQRIDLIVATVSPTGSNVTVNPSIRMPVIVIKEDGAVTTIAFAGFTLGALHLATPQSVGTIIHNDGNVIAIPRGTITVSGPSGAIIRQGVLNTASQAISPGDTQTMTADLHNVGRAFLPGLYHVNLDYGLGGGQPGKHVSKSYLYIAWWHLVVLAVLAALLYYYRDILGLQPKRRQGRKHFVVKRIAA